MGNIKNYTFDRLDFKLSNHDYWDFTLNTDAIKDSDSYNTNLIASFNFSEYSSPDFLAGDFSSSDFSVGSEIENVCKHLKGVKFMYIDSICQLCENMCGPMIK